MPRDSSLWTTRWAPGPWSPSSYPQPWFPVVHAQMGLYVGATTWREGWQQAPGAPQLPQGQALCPESSGREQHGGLQTVEGKWAEVLS